MGKFSDTLKSVPLIAWIIGAAIIIFALWYFSTDIGIMWESRKQKQSDAREAVLIQERDEARKERKAALKKAAKHEMNEIALSGQVETLKAARENYSKTVKEDLKEQDAKIQEVAEEYKTNSQIIKDFEDGKIAPFDFCVWQCDNFKDGGFPCRSNYCDKYKSEE